MNYYSGQLKLSSNMLPKEHQEYFRIPIGSICNTTNGKGRVRILEERRDTNDNNYKYKCFVFKKNNFEVIWIDFLLPEDRTELTKRIFYMRTLDDKNLQWALHSHEKFEEFLQKQALKKNKSVRQTKR